MVSTSILRRRCRGTHKSKRRPYCSGEGWTCQNPEPGITPPDDVSREGGNGENRTGGDNSGSGRGSGNVYEWRVGRLVILSMLMSRPIPMLIRQHHESYVRGNREGADLDYRPPALQERLLQQVQRRCVAATLQLGCYSPPFSTLPS